MAHSSYCIVYKHCCTSMLNGPDIMLEFGLAKKWWDQIKAMFQTEALSRKDIDAILQKLLGIPANVNTDSC